MRYFYDNAYQVLYVPVASRVVLDLADPAVYPFTVLGDNFVASGDFNGGGYSPGSPASYSTAGRSWCSPAITASPPRASARTRRT